MQIRALPLLGLFLAACGPSGAKDGHVSAPALPMPSPTVAPSADAPWVEVRAPSDHALLEAPARALLSADSIEQVALDAPLRVLRVHVQAGDTVAAGDALFDVASETLLGAAAAYESATESLASVSARLDVVRGLHADRLASATDVFELEARVHALRGQQRTALATLQSASLAPSSARSMLAQGRFTLHARRAGIVRDVHAIVGEVHPAGSAFCTLVTGASSRVEARLAFPLEEGFRFRFVDLRGRVVDLGTRPMRTLDSGAEGGAFAWFDLPADADLPAEAPGHLILEPIDQRFVEVPVTALAPHDDGPRVMRRRGDADAQTRVRVIATSGTSAIVEGDLRAGDLVASDGAGATGLGETDAEP